MCSRNTSDSMHWPVFHFEASLACMCTTWYMSFTIMRCGFYYNWNYCSVQLGGEVGFQKFSQNLINWRVTRTLNANDPGRKYSPAAYLSTGPQGCPSLCLPREPRIKYNACRLQRNPKSREGGRNLSDFYKHIHGFALLMPALTEISTGQPSDERPRVRVSGAF